MTSILPVDYAAVPKVRWRPATLLLYLEASHLANRFGIVPIPLVLPPSRTSTRRPQASLDDQTQDSILQALEKCGVSHGQQTNVRGRSRRSPPIQQVLLRSYRRKCWRHSKHPHSRHVQTDWWAFQAYELALYRSHWRLHHYR